MPYRHIFSGKERVLIIPDIQAPYHHRDAVDFLKACKDVVKPTKVVAIGDLSDSHALGYYTRDPDAYSAGHEIQEALKTFKKLYKLFPEAHLMTSNHDDRLFKVGLSAGMPRRGIADLLDFLGAPKGWTLHDHIEIDGVRYDHGDGGKGGMTPGVNQALQNFKSTVIGHFHSSFAINYYANEDKLVFGMNCGCLIDDKAKAFAYAKKNKKKSILGTAAVLYGMPVLIPMMLNSKGRWTKKLPKQL